MPGQGEKRICVIGAGPWGRNHIRTLHEMGCLAGVVEKNAECLAEIAGKYSSARMHTNIEDALDHGYDGYIIATPAETHFPIGSLLLKLRQNVLIEKPMALCSRDSASLTEIARQTGSRLMVGHILLFHPAIQRIKEIIGQGVIGDLWYIYMNRLNFGKVRTEENVLWSFAPHDISVCNYLTGALPVSARACGASFLQDGVHDIAVANFKYPGDVRAHIFVSWLHPFKEQRMVITGSEGTLVFEDTSPEKRIDLYDESMELTCSGPVAKKGRAEAIRCENSSPLKNELEYFVEHLDSEISIADGKSGHEVVELLEQMTACLE